MTEPNHHDGGSKPSSLSGLPDYPVNPSQLSEIDPVACGGCEVIRSDIKTYNVIHIVCLGFLIYLSHDKHFKCPNCMRRFLCRRILPALLLANIFSPIILVWWGGLFLRTFFSR